MTAPHRIATGRLVLRRHTMADLDAFTSFMLDAQAPRWMASTPEQKTAQGARQMLEYVIASYDSPQPVYSLTIADAKTDAYLGSCGMHPLDGEAGMQVYYTVLPAHQGRGLATEAARAMIAAAAGAGVERFVAFVVPANAASVRVAQKLGFVDEGPVVTPEAKGAAGHLSLQGRRHALSREAALLLDTA